MSELINQSKIIYNEIDSTSEKQYKAFIKNIEKLIRSSQEYKYWVYKQRSSKKLICPITKISGDLLKNQLELHHHPYTLFELVEAALEKLQADYMFNPKYDKRFYVINQISSFDVAKYVIELHLIDIIPYVPILSSYHRLYHSGDLDYTFKPEDIINFEKIDILKQELSDLKGK